MKVSLQKIAGHGHKIRRGFIGILLAVCVHASSFADARLAPFDGIGGKRDPNDKEFNFQLYTVKFETFKDGCNDAKRTR